jgi:sulfate adenylyltransferase large subunit
MTARPHPDSFARDASLRQQESKSLLRFIACGSVDHGKSTLIGRLLYEAEALFDDQLSTLEKESGKHGTVGTEPDFSLLLDGLAAEREQKITIDVAYRFFSTAKRKFIVADAPGHEQYTRNMATGASTADLAVLLVNAEQGLTRQTKRHSLIVSMLGVRHLVVAVNKMDLVDWSEPKFRTIEADIRAFARNLDVKEIVCIPTAARSGDNVVARSLRMDWYRGPTLLDHLEEVEIASVPYRRPFRLPIQLVNRPTPDFRGYCGMISSGEAYAGMPVKILPSGVTSYVERIVASDGDLDSARAGQSVTLTLTDDVDVSRGDVIAEIERPPTVADRLAARIVWMGTEPLAPGRSYLLKLGSCSAKAKVEPGLHVFDLDTRALTPASRLGMNDVGHCRLALDRPIAVDPYADGKETGSFILIDPESFDTMGMGLVEKTEAAESWRFASLKQRLKDVIRAKPRRPSLVASGESRRRSVMKAISWRATGSVDTFLVALFITGNSVFAGSIAVTEIITKIMFYYFHERIWSMVSWGRR